MCINQFHFLSFFSFLQSDGKIASIDANISKRDRSFRILVRKSVLLISESVDDAGQFQKRGIKHK